MKRLMAYHSVSQIGYILLALGVGLLSLKDPQAMADYGFTAMKGGIFHILNYTMYKGLLFLSAGAVFYSAGTRDLNELGGLARNMPQTTFMFVIAAAAIAGLPPFNGFVSKLLIYQTTFAVYPLLAVCPGHLGAHAGLLRKGLPDHLPRPTRKAFEKVVEAPASMLLGMAVLTLVIVVLTLFPGWTLSHLVEPAAKALIDQAATFPRSWEVVCNVGKGLSGFGYWDVYIWILFFLIASAAILFIRSKGRGDYKEGTEQDEIFYGSNIVPKDAPTWEYPPRPTGGSWRPSSPITTG